MITQLAPCAIVVLGLALTACNDPHLAPLAPTPDIHPPVATVAPVAAAATLDLTCKTRGRDVVARIQHEQATNPHFDLSLGYHWLLPSSQRWVWVIGPGWDLDCGCDIYDDLPRWCTLPTPLGGGKS